MGSEVVPRLPTKLQSYYFLKRLLNLSIAD